MFPRHRAVAAQALAQGSDRIFAYVLTGTADCIAEIMATREWIEKLIMDGSPATTGYSDAGPIPCCVASARIVIGSPVFCPRGRRQR